jgi:RNA polymerase sigma-70 factor (ECF subfamily)
VRQEIRRCLREDRRLELYYDQLAQTLEGRSNSGSEERREQALRECTQKLPASSAKLVELRYQSALDFGAIAAQVGRTVEATRQQLARIRLTLRECIEKQLAKP